MTSTNSSTNTTASFGSDTGQQHTSLPRLSNEEKTGGWTSRPDIIFPIIGIIFAGISSFFTAYTLLKDDLHENNKGIVLLSEKVGNLETKVVQNSSNLEKISEIETNVAVLQEKVSTNKNNINLFGSNQRSVSKD